MPVIVHLQYWPDYDEFWMKKTNEYVWCNHINVAKNNSSNMERSIMQLVNNYVNTTV